MSEPIWKMSRAQWQHAQGVKQPSIAEISPTQYAKLSRRAQRRYDAQRRVEWDASEECKRQYDQQVVAAYRDGWFEMGDAHEDAQRAVKRDAQRAVQAERAARWKEAQNKNAVNLTELSTGDRVFDVLLQRYGKVLRVFKRSARVEYEAPFSGTRKCPEIHLHKLSHDDLLKATFDGER